MFVSFGFYQATQDEKRREAARGPRHNPNHVRSDPEIDKSVCISIERVGKTFFLSGIMANGYTN